MTVSSRRVAVISGANRGLGLETARQLLKQDIEVVVTARMPARGQSALEELAEEGLTALFHPLDVTSAESVASLGEFVQSHCGRLDILINNAGIFRDGHGHNESDRSSSVFHANRDTLRVTMETNVYGALLLAQEFVPLMRQRRYGRIVNISSGMGQLSDMGGHFPAYRLSKTALNALTRILAAETAGHNILVNAICPGWVKTDMGGVNAERTAEEAARGVVWAATLADDGPNGGFFRDTVAIDW
jgi:NAD(P)-dependent dehydrogenase (short-subunit alcohol dehydrogenase family)